MLSATGSSHLRAGRHQGRDLSYSSCSPRISTPTTRSSRVALATHRCLRRGQFSGPAGTAAGGGGRGRAATVPRLVIVHSLGSGRAGGSGASDAPRVEEPSTALLLAWFACGNRSLFAAQCLVEVLVELYREGRTFGELQLSLKLATQGARRRRSRGAEDSDAATADPASAPGGRQRLAADEEEVLPPLLQGQEEDVLVSWVALVFLTLEELGVPRDRIPQQQGEKAELAGTGTSGGGADAGNSGSGSSSMAAGNTYLRGMLGYVRQTLGMYDEGQTLARVAGLQGLVQQSSGAASSPFLVLMQQYTRLVLLTVEVVAAGGLPTVRPLRLPETVLRPSGYSQAFSSSCNAVLEDKPLGSPAKSQDQQQQMMVSEAAPEACPARGLAVRLLIAFMGAVLGSQWSLAKFVEAVRVAYDQGLAADELFSQLDEQEFVQSGGLLPISSAAAAAPEAAAAAAPDSAREDSAAAPQPAPQYQITKALLSTWISLSYMTLAQLAIPYPDAGRRLGWAWVGFGDPTEALGMNDFVGNVLRQMAGEDPRTMPSSPDVLDGSNPNPDSDPDATRAGARRRDGALMVRVEDESLPATSTAVRVLTQQVALVQAVCRMVVMED